MWIEKKRVDGVVVYEGPANDTLVIEFENPEARWTADDEPDYGAWTWTASVADSEGNIVSDGVVVFDKRLPENADNDKCLQKQVLINWTEDGLTPGEVYYGGVRGVNPDETWGDTYLEIELHAGRILVP